MRLTRGVHAQLEAEADRIIHGHLKQITRHQDKSDILTPWKEQDRRSHEMYVGTGVPDPAERSGMFHRSLNPRHRHLNSATNGSLNNHKTHKASQGYEQAPGSAWDKE